MHGVRDQAWQTLLLALVCWCPQVWGRRSLEVQPFNTMLPRKGPPPFMEREACGVCVFRSLWGRGLEWTHYSKRPPFGLCQVRNPRKLRPPKQAAPSPSTVLGEDWRPGFSDSLGGLERLQDQGHGSSAASSQAVPLNCPVAAVLTEQPWDGWAISGTQEWSGSFRPLGAGPGPATVRCSSSLQRYVFL